MDLHRGVGGGREGGEAGGWACFKRTGDECTPQPSGPRFVGPLPPPAAPPREAQLTPRPSAPSAAALRRGGGRAPAPPPAPRRPARAGGQAGGSGAGGGVLGSTCSSCPLPPPAPFHLDGCVQGERGGVVSQHRLRPLRAQLCAWGGRAGGRVGGALALRASLPQTAASPAAKRPPLPTPSAHVARPPPASPPTGP